MSPLEGFVDLVAALGALRAVEVEMQAALEHGTFKGPGDELELREKLRLVGLQYAESRAHAIDHLRQVLAVRVATPSTETQAVGFKFDQPGYIVEVVLSLNGRRVGAWPLPDPGLAVLTSDKVDLGLRVERIR